MPPLILRKPIPKYLFDHTYPTTTIHIIPDLKTTNRQSPSTPLKPPLKKQKITKKASPSSVEKFMSPSFHAALYQAKCTD